MVSPRAVDTIREDNFNISNHTSNKGNNFEHEITVSDNACKRCPFFPSRAQKFHHNFPDPAKATGTATEIMREFSNVTNQTKTFCRNFVAQYL